MQRERPDASSAHLRSNRSRKERSVSGRGSSRSSRSSMSSYSSYTSDGSVSSGDSDHDHHEELSKRPKKEFRMTTNHSKLLILISKYAQCALSADDQETWLRETPLLVLIYEGIMAQELNFDYAPRSIQISHDGTSRRMFFNLSQEGLHSIDNLREQKLINCIKLTTEDQQPVSAYQVSLKGLQYLKTLPNSIFEEVNEFVYAPHAPHYDTELLEVHYDGENFVLKSKAGYMRTSRVTEMEDVSYVSSPVLPLVLRSAISKPMSSNAHRAHESAAGADNLRDDVDEAIILTQVSVYVTEFVPMGVNAMVTLNDRLGAMDRCQGGLFTSAVDSNPLHTSLHAPPDLTSVTIIDFEVINFINFETEIRYAESSGIVQVESFGMHFNSSGLIFNGMKIEAINDRLADNVSIDMLTRVMVDLLLDSSRIADDLLSWYQRSLLDMMFLGDAANRNKYVVVLAETIQPRLSAHQYLDGAEFELEIKQIVGDIYLCEEIGKQGSGTLIIIGREGLLVVGKQRPENESVLIHFIALQTQEAFIRNLFFRIFVLLDTLKKIRQLILQVEDDPDNVIRIRTALSEASRDLILLQETAGYTKESLQSMDVPKKPSNAEGRKLYRILQIDSLGNDTLVRVEDLNKLLDGAVNQLQNLQQTTDVINTRQLEDAYVGVEQNTKFLVAASAANERASASLAIMQVVLAGGFAFDFLDRITGGTLNVDPPEWAVTAVFQPLVDPPFIFWTINIVWLMAFCYTLVRLMRYLVNSTEGIFTIRIKVNKKIKSEDGLHAFLGTKTIESTDIIIDPISSCKVIIWEEDDDDKWLGAGPQIELKYDDRYNFLLSAAFELDKKKSDAKESDLLDILMLDLVHADAVDRKVAFGVDSMEGDMEAKIARTKMRLAANSKLGFLMRLLGRASGPTHTK